MISSRLLAAFSSNLFFSSQACKPLAVMITYLQGMAKNLPTAFSLKSPLTMELFSRNLHCAYVNSFRLILKISFEFGSGYTVDSAYWKTHGTDELYNPDYPNNRNSAVLGSAMVFYYVVTHYAESAVLSAIIFKS